MKDPRQLERSLVVRHRASLHPPRKERPCESLPKLGLDPGARRILSEKPRLGEPEPFAHGHLRRGLLRSSRPRERQEPAQRSDTLARSLELLGLCPTRPARLDPRRTRHEERRHEDQQQPRNQRGGPPVPRHELAKRIPDARGLREHGEAAQVAFEIIRELARRGVALRRALGHRACNDPIEFAVEPPHDLRRRRRVLPQDLLSGRHRTSGVVAKGPHSGQKLIEHHTERVHVAGRIDFAYGGIDLFGREIGQRALEDSLTAQDARIAGIPQSGHAKVQHTQRTVRLDHDIGWLEI
jgi:hypothetical protein